MQDFNIQNIFKPSNYVADVLDYSDASKMCERLDDDEKSNRQIGGLGSPTGGRGTIITSTESHLLTKRLDDDEKQNRQIAGFGPRGLTIINESGLYTAILGKEVVKRPPSLTASGAPKTNLQAGATSPRRARKRHRR